jgi:hypothetical protein
MMVNNSTIQYQQSEQPLLTFPRSWLITEFVTRITRRLSLVEQELLTIPEHLSSPPVFSGFVLLDLWFYMYVL